MGVKRGERICRLCDGSATVGPIIVPGEGLVATARTDCPTCGIWTISGANSPLLDKANAEARRCISAKVREELKAHPDSPLEVDAGLIRWCYEQRGDHHA